MFFRKFITTSSESSVTIILFSAKVASEIQTVMVIISRVKLKKKQRILNLKAHYTLNTVSVIERGNWPEVTDPDLELRGVGWFCFTSPCWLFSLLSFLFLPKIKGGPPPGTLPRSATDQYVQQYELPLNITRQTSRRS